MKIHSGKNLSILFFGLAFLGAGAVLWTIPYKEIQMLSWPFVIKWSIPAVLIGFIAVPAGKKYPGFSALLITAGYIAAVMARVIYDGFNDPTSHNLWPFEVAIAVGIAFPVSFFGAIISYLIYRKRVKG